MNKFDLIAKKAKRLERNELKNLLGGKASLCGEGEQLITCTTRDPYSGVEGSGVVCANSASDARSMVQRYYAQVGAWQEVSCHY